MDDYVKNTRIFSPEALESARRKLEFLLLQHSPIYDAVVVAR